MSRIPALLLLFAGLVAAQAPDPVWAALDNAYRALNAHDYDTAIAAFRKAVALAPTRPAIHKDLAYTLLKVGDNEAARDQFGEAMRLDPADDHVALEYAFLCYETKQQPEARRIFDRIRRTGNATAEQAFQNIDRPLEEGIARWSKALESEPGNFSAHRELATLAEQRDELKLAAEHYEKAWRIKPGERELLLDMGRVWQKLGATEKAHAALLAVSRGAQPRVRERATELLPARYPYVNEFRKALELDAGNIELRRELAYLYLEMGNGIEADRQFELLHQQAPDDRISTAQLGLLKLGRGDEAGARPLLESVLKGEDDDLADRVRAALKYPQTLKHRSETPKRQVSGEAKALADKSYAAGYMKDALKYYMIAHESDPVDFTVMLKLGWAYNILHDDPDAERWFNLARHSSDPEVAKQAGEAWRNLETANERFRTTVWVFPFFSSRWHDLFSYGQAKTQMQIGSLPVSAYLSTRFVGDARVTTGPVTGGITQPQYLSEDSFILAFGLASHPWHGMTAWGEAGEAIKYLNSRHDVGTMIPDYRGGLSWARALGHAAGGHGRFFETNDDLVFVSRFANDVMVYSQNRAGFGFGKVQFYWNGNITADSNHQYWANTVETGPGLRFHVPQTPKTLLFSLNGLRGANLTNVDNPRRPNYFDVRAGFWYAFAH
ncbi:MAG: tetratricopeptide repeat protein [Bryobacteraceae bacterium]